MTQSMRGRRGRDHAPAALTYGGRLVVEKNPSGRTPSAGAGSNRAAGPRTQRPHDATDCAWLRGLHEDVPAPASLEPLDRARRRSEHAERTGEPLGIGPDEPLGHTLGRPLDPAGVLM